jgi:sugar phosphate isomerase/epimerase
VRPSLTRRDWFAASSTTAAAALVGAGASARPSRADATTRDGKLPCRLSLNTSTIRGQKLSLAQEIDLAAEAGFDCIEPWISELEDHVKSGGTLSDVSKRIADRGLTVESAIGFFDWPVDEPERREKGLEAGKRAMDLVQQIGGKRLACPPSGITERSDVPHAVIAERFRAVGAMGRAIGIVPQLEVWGFSKSVTTLADAAMIALAAGDPDAAILADIYHLYKGGSPFETVGLMSRTAFQVFHVNDYPDLPRDQIKDEHRVYPGDGIAPLTATFKRLWAAGFAGTLSLELFNREYWAQDARQVVQTGHRKLREAVEASLA